MGLSERVLLAIEIDEMQVKIAKSKVKSRAEPFDQINELNEKIETARDKLIQILFAKESR